MAAAPRPPSAWQLEKSVSLWQQLRETLQDDMSLSEDEAVTSLPDSSLPSPHVLLQRAIDAAVWSDLRADEADNLRKRFAARRDRYQERGAKIRQTINDLLQVLDLKAAEGDLGSADLVKGPRAVLITDIDQVPTELKAVVTTVTAKKNPIGDKLKAGETVPGAELSNPGLVLRITPY